jgi:hypothetical protein
MTTPAGGVTGALESQAVSQLVVRERQSRDRGWWDDMAACFADDAVIDMSWFSGPAAEFIRQTRQRSSDGVWGRHRLLPPAVRVRGDRAWAEVPLGIEFSTQIDGVAADLVSYCRLSTAPAAKPTEPGAWPASPPATNATPRPERDSRPAVPRPLRPDRPLVMARGQGAAG